MYRRIQERSILKLQGLTSRFHNGLFLFYIAANLQKESPLRLGTFGVDIDTNPERIDIYKKSLTLHDPKGLVISFSFICTKNTGTDWHAYLKSAKVSMSRFHTVYFCFYKAANLTGNFQPSESLKL